jgi:hypothetical protein
MIYSTIGGAVSLFMVVFIGRVIFHYRRRKKIIHDIQIVRSQHRKEYLKELNPKWGN